MLHVQAETVFDQINRHKFNAPPITSILFYSIHLLYRNNHLKARRTTEEKNVNRGNANI